MKYTASGSFICISPSQPPRGTGRGDDRLRFLGRRPTGEALRFLIRAELLEFRGELLERDNRAALLPGQETLWLGAALAAQILKHDSQMWAVRDWMKFRGAPRRGGLS